MFTKSLPLKEIMTIDEVDIEEHNNNPHTLFKRGTNSFFDGTTLADAKALINTSFSSNTNLHGCKNPQDISAIPDSYNFHIQTPRCGSKIANQQSK